VKSSFYPLCECIGEDEHSVDQKEPIYTSLILSTPGPFTVGRKDKRRNSELLQDKPIDDNRRLAVWKCWLQGFTAPVCITSDSRKKPYGDIKLNE